MSSDGKRVYELTVNLVISGTCQVAAESRQEAIRLATDLGLPKEVDNQEIRSVSVISVDLVKE